MTQPTVIDDSASHLNAWAQWTHRIARIFFKLAYKAQVGLWFVTRPTVYGVYVAVWHRQSILIIRNSYRKTFTVPCGRVKRGEELVAAAVRELREEVNLDMSRTELTYFGECIGRFKYVIDIGHFFETDLAERPEIQVDQREVIWGRFLDAQKVGEINLSPTVRAYLDKRLSVQIPSDQKP